MADERIPTGSPKTVISVKVIPRSSGNQIIGFGEGMIKVKLTAAPVEGRANKALKGLLAKRLGLSKGNVEIISGERSRQKSVLIHGLSPDKVDALLQKP
jgi:uncharacterized protein (TIGR00251 family)